MKARIKSEEQYAELKAHLIVRGYTLRSFALQHGYPIGSVYCAARGLRGGVKAVKIAKHLNQIAYAKTK